MRKSILALSIGRFASSAIPTLTVPVFNATTRFNPAELTFRPAAIVVDAIGNPDPMNIAKDGAKLLSKERIKAILDPGHKALAAGRAGRFQFSNWLALGTMVHLGVGIEERRIVRGLKSYFQAAYDALQGLSNRMEPAGTWIPGPLTGPEIHALDDLLWAYEQQMRVVCVREYNEVRKKAVAQVRSKRGNFITGQALVDLKAREALH